MTKFVHETCLLLVAVHDCKTLPDNRLAHQLLLEWFMLLSVGIAESALKQRSR